MLTIPKILDTPEFLDAPLDYKWDKETSGFYAVDAQNQKLEKELDKLDYKVVFGIATALCEWIYWRMSKHIERPGIPLALEAQWAGLINKHYFYSWKYDADYVSDVLNGPTYSMWKNTHFITYNYETNNFCDDEGVARLGIIARHICPDKELFDSWLNDIITKASELFPYKENSDNPVIPRQFFFEPNYDYQTADNAKIINDFFSSLDYKKNEFLNSPKEMKKRGFKGTPYKYEPK